MQSITSSLMEKIGKAVYQAFGQSKHVTPWPDGKPPRINQGVFNTLRNFRSWNFDAKGEYDLSVMSMAKKLAEFAKAGKIKATADEVVAYLQIMVYDEIRNAIKPKK